MEESPESFRKIYNRLSQLSVNMIDRAKMREHSFVLIVAVIIGILGGFGAVGIQEAIKFFKHVFWRGDFTFEHLAGIKWYWKILIPVGGGLFAGLIVQFIAKEAKGHGVPEVMESITLKSGIIRPRVVFAKLFASAVYISSGGSVGREGPVVQIGSAIGSAIGQFFKVNPRRMRVFVACGAASGIAAAFNAPVAGALFAVEVILADFAIPHFSPVVISSVMATVVSRHFLGNYPAFVVPKYQLGSPYELLFYVVLGFLAAGVALLFIKVLYSSEDFFDNLKWPEYAKAGIGGLGIGLIGLFMPHIFGVGYESIDIALQSNMIWKLALGLVFLKIFATSLSLGSGGSGGIFAPSLFMGAMLGSFYGSAIAALFPGMNISSGAYALVAMGGVVAAATHGPIAAILIIFEMSNDYKIILPLMITCIIATVIAMRLKDESIYTLKLKLRGINIHGGRDFNVLRSLTVRDVYDKNLDMINEYDKYPDIVEQIAESPHNCFYVVDEKQAVKGIITINDIRHTIRDYDSLKHILIARDIMRPNVVSVSVDDTLDEVMKKFGIANHDELAVVSPENNKKLIGSIIQQDVIEAYNRQIFLRNMSGELSTSLQKTRQQKDVHVIEDYHLLEIETPMLFLGKTIKELDIRRNYQVEILLVKKAQNGVDNNNQSIQPDGDYKFEIGDQLLLFGREKYVNILEKL